MLSIGNEQSPRLTMEKVGRGPHSRSLEPFINERAAFFV